MTEQQRVPSTDSCGASPGKSALDRSTRRDPGGANTNLTRAASCRATGRLAQTHCGRVKQITSESTRSGFFVTFGEGISGVPRLSVRSEDFIQHSERGVEADQIWRGRTSSV